MTTGVLAESSRGCGFRAADGNPLIPRKRESSVVNQADTQLRLLLSQQAMANAATVHGSPEKIKTKKYPVIFDTSKLHNKYLPAPCSRWHAACIAGSSFVFHSKIVEHYNK
jgi:hypothetical protein